MSKRIIKMRELNINLGHARFTLRYFGDTISMFAIRNGEEDWLPLPFDEKQTKQIIDFLSKTKPSKRGVV